MSQKLNGGGREQLLQVADLGFKNCKFRAKKSHFWTQTALEPIQNGQTKGKGGYTPRAA